MLEYHVVSGNFFYCLMLKLSLSLPLAEDDPDDADFDPYYGITSGHAGDKVIITFALKYLLFEARFTAFVFCTACGFITKLIRRLS